MKMNEVTLKYSVSEMKPAVHHWMRWVVELSDEEMGIYQNAIANKIPLNEVEELQSALYRAKVAIIASEQELAEDSDETFDLENWGIKVEFID